MKALGFAFLTAVAISQAPNTGRAEPSIFFINLQNDHGNTRVSVSWTGDIVTTGIPDPYGAGWLGVGGFFLNSMTGVGGSPTNVPGLGSFVGFVNSLPDFGTFKDLTTDTTAKFDTLVVIPNYLGSGSVINLRFDHGIGSASTDIIQYVPGVDSATFPIPFSLFNPGTYLISPNQPVGQVLTVEPIPEPSTALMIILGCLALSACRRSRP